MLQKIIDFPSQVAEAYSLLRIQKDLPPEFGGKFSSIVILGMGGSGIAGDFVRVLLRNSSIPVHVCKNSRPPNFVNDQTLVIAITYSGKTHETLDALNASIHAGAKCIVITSSHELGSTCEEKNIPWVFAPWNSYSRASFGYMLMPVLGILNKIGLFPTIDSDISEAITVLNEISKECDPSLPLRKNPARLLAQSLTEKLPVIYGEHNFTDVIALRWKQQLNENAKIHCYYEVFPELLHNEIEVWDSDSVSRDIGQSYAPIFLRDSMHEHDNHFEDQIEIAKHLVEIKGKEVFELWTKGKSELARLLSLSYIADFVSVYLAASRGANPESTSNIDSIKKNRLTHIERS
jgi:glucose/mannose-6-phosphate isomerase